MQALGPLGAFLGPRVLSFSFCFSFEFQCQSFVSNFSRLHCAAATLEKDLNMIFSEEKPVGKSLFATVEGTRPAGLALGFESRRRELYPGGPWVSPVGFGSYRIGFSAPLGAPECATALEKALESGCNLIDTSTNYGNGQSELLIGKTLTQFFSQGKLRRENVVLISKAGYVQGNNLELVRRRMQEGHRYEGLVEFSADLCYSIDPSFLEDQLERSCQRLNVTCLDSFLLHNPEYLLKKWESEGISPSQAREQFYAAIEKAFSFLEKMVQVGKIQSYGLSSNTLGFPEEDPTAVSLWKCLETAQKVNKQHHFRIVQCPLNWIELFPFLLGGDGKQESSVPNTLDFAKQNGIGLLINRPFNAMLNNGLIRLTRPFVPDASVLDDAAKRGLANWEALSADLEQLARSKIDVPGYEDATLSQFVVCTLMWLPGVSSVLCGMRKLRYVEDVELAVKRPVLLHAREIVGRIYDELEFHRDDEVR